MNLPDETYVCEKGRCQQASAHLIMLSVIYVKIGRRLQMAAVYNLVCQAHTVITRSHCAVQWSTSPQLLIITLSTAHPSHPIIEGEI